MNSYSVLFFWLELFVFYQLYRIYCCIDGLKFLVKVYFGDLPEDLLKCHKIYCPVVLVLQTPHFQFFVNRFAENGWTFFRDQNILNFSFRCIDRWMDKFIEVMNMLNIVWESMKSNFSLLVHEDGSHDLNFTAMKILQHKYLVVLFDFISLNNFVQVDI